MEPINYDAKACVFNIQRFSLNDGPGIRTIVFIKGCPLRCRWCFNPESQDPRPTPQFGKIMTVREVFNQVKKEQAIFRRSGGGITFSGGEALTQPDFVEALIRAAHLSGFNTNVETAGYVPEETIRRIIPQLDYVYMDIKAVPADVHKWGTGCNNLPILRNALIASKLAKHMVVRVPVIPTFNYDPKQIEYICRFTEHLHNIDTIHLLPYTTVGVKKYKALNRKYLLEGIKPLSNDDLMPLKKIVESHGFHCILGG